MMRTISRLLICYFVLWLALSAVGKFISNQFFISSQISFFASLVILTASFFAYKNRINSRLESARDEILAKIEEDDEDDENLAQNEAKEFSLKDEKARLKKQKFSFKDKSFVAAFMPYRLVAYAILFFGFIFLKNENLLNVSAFLVGLAPMPIGAFVFGLMENKFNTAKDTDGK
ncbi:membrane protein [Campylobacter concisus]|nr:membrane protein [Campylobacter concisus]